MTRKRLWQTAVSVALVFAATATWAQSPAPNWVTQARQGGGGSPLSQEIRSSNGTALTNYVHGYIEVTGYGAAKRTGNAAQEMILAMDAARTIAFAKLSETIYGVRVKGKSMVRDGVASGQIVVKDLEAALIKNAITLEEGTQEGPKGETVGVVKLGYLLNGPNGLAGAIVSQERALADLRLPEEETFMPASAPPPPPPSQPYTGLIVDAGGKGLAPGLFPKILAAGDGRVLYSAASVNDPDVLVNGLVRYAPSEAVARNLEGSGGPMVGANPLVVRAAAASGDISAVVSDEDAVKIYGADLKSKFLGKGRVVFVIN